MCACISKSTPHMVYVPVCFLFKQMFNDVVTIALFHSSTLFYTMIECRSHNKLRCIQQNMSIYFRCSTRFKSGYDGVDSLVFLLGVQLWWMDVLNHISLAPSGTTVGRVAKEKLRFYSVAEAYRLLSWLIQGAISF